MSSSETQSSQRIQCHHIKTSGVRCGSPALRHRRYCYYHQRSRPVLIDCGGRDKAAFIALPPLEDAHAIQCAIHGVARQLLAGAISQKTAGLMFYALQIASKNLQYLKAEAPQPDEVVIDPPKLSEIDRPAPTHFPLRMNSHTNRMTHYPETPSFADEYYDDLLRATREMHEDVLEQVQRMQQPPVESETKSTADTSSNSGGNPKLPPGTIQACARRTRQVN